MVSTLLKNGKLGKIQNILYFLRSLTNIPHTDLYETDGLRFALPTDFIRFSPDINTDYEYSSIRWIEIYRKGSKCEEVTVFKKILLSAFIGTRQEQTQRYITHATTNTQPAFGSVVLIKGRRKFRRSKNVPRLIQNRLFQIELAFSY